MISHVSLLELSCTITRLQSTSGELPERIELGWRSEALFSRDLRNLTLQSTYTEAHSDDITSLNFHPSPSLPHVLLSASVDGLLNTYDVRVADEDDSVLSTSQVGASLVSAGWMALKGQEEKSELKGVWGATTIETVQLWDAEDVSCIHRATLSVLIPSFISSRLRSPTSATSATLLYSRGVRTISLVLIITSHSEVSVS